MLLSFQNLPALNLTVMRMPSSTKSIAASNYFSYVQYKTEEPVKLWVNKVGPYNNPQETYNYYSLPFCQPSENPAHKWGGLGEVLGGNELIDSQIDIKFISMLAFS
jgi:transmembrane 9 superfamily protein 3